MTQAEQDKLVEAGIARLKKSKVTRKGSFATNALHMKKSADEQTSEFQSDADDMYIASTILKKPVQELKLYKNFRNKYDDSELAKAMNLSNMSGFIPTDLSPQIINMIDVERRLSKVFKDVPMPTSPYEIPRKNNHTTVYKGVENTAPTESEINTDGYGATVTFTAEELVGYTTLSYQLDEDAINDQLAMVKEDLAIAIAQGEESCIVRGCEDNTIESDNDSATNLLRVVDAGLVATAINNGFTKDMGTFTINKLLEMKSSLGKYGVRPEDLVWIVSPTTSDKLITAADSNSNTYFATLDKIGASAGNNTGMVGRMFGSDVFVSADMREDLNASGLYDGTTKTKTGIICVNKKAFGIGRRRGMLLESDRIIEKRSHQIVGSIRMDFQSLYSSNQKTIAYGYNVAV